ncbi:P-loop ATPase, Sll1717 family [Ruegeria sp. HKCCA0235A]|uniref:P-loop ATPase, Sll1717 family n=1 Tax=Ruegeria sp. HKCCA0235A TaxID=2682998 RepID=UPI00148A0A91|nr:ATP-binding protein [Ruegeria sp. HKCCA0235A]
MNNIAALRVNEFNDETILKMFGAQAAEDENFDRLKGYFVRNKAYERLRADIKLRLLVGHKGIGKSALLKMAHNEEIDAGILSIWLQPNDISKAWTVEGQFVERVEKIKQNILKIISEKSLEAINIFGTDAGDSAVVKSVRQLVPLILKAGGKSDEASIDAKLYSNFKKHPRIIVHIDDIDRGWSANSKDVENISALINAARDIVNSDETLTFRIGLRTDAYNLVREHDESGDKFEPYKVPIVWSNHDILVMMAKRVSNYFGQAVEEGDLNRKSQKEISKYLYPVIEENFIGTGHWANRPIHNVLLSLTRRRPRDLVKLLSGAAQMADTHRSNRIFTNHLEESFPEYSKGRISDLISEFGSELPKIKDVLYSMKPTAKEIRAKEKRFLYTNDEIIKKLNGIAANQNVFFAKGTKASGPTLLEFLYKIDFVIARKDAIGEIDRLYYQDHSNLVSTKADFGYKWEVHPAYRWALNPSKVDQLLSDVDA